MEGIVTGGLEAEIVVRRGAFEVGISLAIPSGRTVALLGPNGAGKSTTVAVLAGLLALDSGHIRLDARTLDDPDRGVFVVPEQRRIGVVFQNLALFPHLSVAENIAFGPRSRGKPGRAALAEAQEWMDRLDLTGLAGRAPAALSGGQAQRVALARALATEPDLLLLDEPLSALDMTTRIRSRRFLAEHLRTFPGPRLLITHDPTEAFLLADEVHVIENGAISQIGDANDIRLRPLTPYVADLAGSNLIVGEAADGIVMVGGHTLHVADTAVAGPVLVTIRPSAIALHSRQPEGSPRNVWRTTVPIVETLGDRVRLLTGEPLALTAEVTPEAVRDLGLVPGAEVWVAIKATEIVVHADTGPTGSS